MQGRKRVVVLASGDPISTEPSIIGDSLTLSTGQGNPYQLRHQVPDGAGGLA